VLRIRPTEITIAALLAAAWHCAAETAPANPPVSTPPSTANPAAPSSLPSAASAADSETAALIDGILDSGRAWLEENFQTDEIGTLSPDQIHQLAARLQPVADSLALGSIDDLAALQPQAAELLAWLRTQSWGAPYADWLAPRIDYLDLAAETVDLSRRQWDTEQQRLRSQPPADPALPPPERPRPTLRFEVVRDRVYRSVNSNKAWIRRISCHNPPAGAVKLTPLLKDVFRSEGIAPEWVWLAEVESSFDPEAESPAGARGLFQLMPATAKRFGLKTFPVDERTNPQKSARAAAQYLRFLHSRFGEWPLALAAYNAGEGRISQELSKAARRSFDEIADRLPAETRFYVPKVMATVAAREKIDPFGLPAPAVKTSGTTLAQPLSVAKQ
jgi:membrane-bound lytic murein transglycosylase D